MRKHATAIIFLFLLVPIAHAQHTITTVAGGVPENENALSVGLGYPFGVAVDSVGNLYIADYFNSSIFEVNLLGQLSTIAGVGASGFSGDGGPAASAELFAPEGVFVDGSGNIFIADTYNNRIREVVASTGIIKTVAGNGTPGLFGTGFSGDGGPATNAELAFPTAVFVDGFGNIFIADSFNQRIREVFAATGIIQTVAGNGTLGFSGDGGPATSAELFDPGGLFVDSSGNIFIADTFNFRIREVVAATDLIQTVAGNGTSGFSGDGGPATSAELGGPIGPNATGAPSPEGVFVDAAGNIFIADSQNNRIREVGGPNNITIGPGVIQTLAGNGTSGFSGDGGPAASAELYLPAGMFVDGLGNIFLADTINNLIREVAATTGTIRTIAGNGTVNFSGDGVPATNAELDSFYGLFVDHVGNIFIPDAQNNRIREVVATTGKIFTVAGNGTAGSNGIMGPATSANLNLPTGVFVDRSGNIFIADSNNSRICEVVATTGEIQIVAGNGTAGFSGDGGPATGAELNIPNAVFVDDSGNIFIADSQNNRIREVFAATGIIQTIAGNGTIGFFTHIILGDGGPATSAQVSFPNGVFVDSLGDIFIADTSDNAIREVGGPNNTTIGPGVIQTVAGNGTNAYSGDGGSATSAELFFPTGVFVDGSENIFIADAFNNVIREVGGPNNTTIGPGVIQTIAGNGTVGFSGDGGPASSAILYTPTAVWGNLSGNLLISDASNDRVRSVAGLTSVPSVTFSPPTLPLTTGQTGNIIALNSGAAPLVISSISFTGANPGDFIFGSSTTCPLNGGTLAAQVSCTLVIALPPSLQRSGTAAISVTDNAANSPQLVEISVSTVPVVSFRPQSLTLNAIGAPQNVNLTNTGPVPLLISSIALTGLNPAAFAFAPATTCSINGGVLASQASCILSVSFGATSQGTPASASLTVTDNAANPTQSVPLRGAALIVTSNGPFAVSRGQTLTVNLELLGPPSTVTYSLACSASPSGPIIICDPTSVAGPNQTLGVTISATTSSSVPPGSPTSWMDGLPYVSFAFLLSVLWVICGRQRMPIQSRIYVHITIAVLCLLAVALSSCTTGGITERASVATVTPGAYTVTVIATPSNSSGNLTATFPVSVN